MLAIPLAIAGGRQEPLLPESPCLGSPINQMPFVAETRPSGPGTCFGEPCSVWTEPFPSRTWCAAGWFRPTLPSARATPAHRYLRSRGQCPARFLKTARLLDVFEHWQGRGHASDTRVDASIALPGPRSQTAT